MDIYFSENLLLKSTIITSVSKVAAQIALLNLSELFLNEWDKIIFSGKPMMCRFVNNNFLVDYKLLTFSFGSRLKDHAEHKLYGHIDVIFSKKTKLLQRDKKPDSTTNFP